MTNQKWLGVVTFSDWPLLFVAKRSHSHYLLKRAYINTLNVYNYIVREWPFNIGEGE